MKKNVRTKIKKTERVEFRCTKAFKKTIEELSVQNNMTLSNFIEKICTDKILESIGGSNNQKSSPIEKQKISPGAEKKDNKALVTPTRSKREDYEKEIWRMLQEGATPTETAEWLNVNGFTPQRGEQFTMNSVHSIRRRLKKQIKES